MLVLFNSSASDIFFPGTEDPTSILNWFLLYVTKHPDLQAKIHRQLDDVIGNTRRLPELSDKPNLPYLEAFIAEVQRIVSETPLAVPHSTTRDTSLAGFFIPRDMTVFVNLWAFIMILIAGRIHLASGQSGSWTKKVDFIQRVSYHSH